MNVAFLNGGALLGALLAGALLSMLAASGPHDDAESRDTTEARFSRIVSGSTIADQILLELVDPRRIAAVTRHTKERGIQPWRYAGFAELRTADDVEAVLAFQPDLVVINNVGDPRRMERLREAGVRVVDLGPMLGRATFVEDIRELSALLGVPARGAEMAARFERRLESIAPTRLGDDALYVGPVGGQLYGGTRGTNYHDVLIAAGLRDAAADAGYEGWPVYGAETVLTLDPSWIVTPAEHAEGFCARPGFDVLQACVADQVIGIEGRVLNDPGWGMLDAAEALHHAVRAAR